MTSRNSPSSSTEPRGPQTLVELLDSSESLRKVVRLFRTPEWEAMELLLGVLKADCLERLLVEDSPSDREEFRIIAKFINDLLGSMREQITDAERATREPQVEMMPESGSPYMEPDSDQQPDAEMLKTMYDPTIHP